MDRFVNRGPPPFFLDGPPFARVGDGDRVFAGPPFAGVGDFARVGDFAGPPFACDVCVGDGGGDGVADDADESLSSSLLS